MKTSWRCLGGREIVTLKTSWRRLQVIFTKMNDCWKDAEIFPKIFKTLNESNYLSLNLTYMLHLIDEIFYKIHFICVCVTVKSYTCLSEVNIGCATWLGVIHKMRQNILVTYDNLLQTKLLLYNYCYTYNTVLYV